jgi:predicted ATPase
VRSWYHEHLIEAVAELATTLLAHCPDLRILVTSRQSLGVDGEVLVPIEPLPVDDQDGTPGPGVQLLFDRVRAAQVGWTPSSSDLGHARAICLALDGLPLALELAAARARALGLAEIAAHLDHNLAMLGPVPRGSLNPHATLQTAIGWSVEQLDAHDRAMLLRLWPFEGGFSLEASQAAAPAVRRAPLGRGART